MWTHLDSPERTHLNSLELTGIQWDSLAPTSTRLNSLENHLELLENSLELTWTPLDSLEITWTHLNSLELTGTHLNILGLTWAHLDSLDITCNHFDITKGNETKPGPKGEKEKQFGRKGKGEMRIGRAAWNTTWAIRLRVRMHKRHARLSGVLLPTLYACNDFQCFVFVRTCVRFPYLAALEQFHWWTTEVQTDIITGTSPTMSELWIGLWELRDMYMNRNQLVVCRAHVLLVLYTPQTSTLARLLGGPALTTPRPNIPLLVSAAPAECIADRKMDDGRDKNEWIDELKLLIQSMYVHMYS